MICFRCRQEGHIERDCAMTAFDDDPGPYWCGICEKRTRLVGTSGGQPGRCPDCHPLRYEHLKHIQRCPSCHMLIHDWDNAPCGQHSSPVAPDRRPSTEHIREITRRTT